jgi:hypothetical protein
MPAWYWGSSDASRAVFLATDKAMIHTQSANSRFKRSLSILFLAPEILRARRGETSFTIRHPWVVAFAFGLLHGFGFASAMSAAGLPPADLPLALVSFNVGVEIGQLAFVALILLLMRGAHTLVTRWPRPVELLPAYVVGTFGAFWMIQRIVAM